MKQALLYSLKVWLSTVFLSSLVDMAVQMTFLYPNYHPFFPSNQLTDNMLQFACMMAVNIVILLPMVIVLVLLTMRYLKRMSSRNLLLNLTVVFFAIVPELIFIGFDLSNSSVSELVQRHTDIGFMVNGFTNSIIALLCVRYFKLRPEISKTDVVLQNRF